MDTDTLAVVTRERAPRTFRPAEGPFTSANLLAWLWLPLLTCLGVLLFGIAQLFIGPDPFLYVWDDSYMFVRYADNLRAFHTIAWNPGGAPTYGLTSPLFLSVVLPVRLLLPGNPMATAALSSLLCGLAFVALLLLLVQRATDAPLLVRRVILLVTLASLAGAGLPLARHFVSGMDTMFALTFLTLLLWFSLRQEQSPSLWRAVALGVFGGSAYFARPDLLIYATLIPGAQIALNPATKTRRLWLLTLLLTAATVGIEMAAAALYFHSPFPLPFYAKSMGLYADFNPVAYRHTPLRELLDYLCAYRYLLLAIGLDLALNRPAWKRESTPMEKGLLAVTLVLLLYYLLFVLQIMGHAGRFYYPTLPALAFLAARSTARLARRARELAPPAFTWPRLYGVGLVLLIEAVVLPPRPSDDYALLVKLAHRMVARFDVLAHYQVGGDRLWFRLDDFSRLPDDLVIATTEVGHPAALNPHKRIIDLAGLNDTELARHRFSAQRLFQEVRPDLLYMPHPDYRGMLRELSQSPIFRSEYVYYPAETLGPSIMGLALRRDSRYFPAMQRIVAQGRARRPAADAKGGE